MHSITVSSAVLALALSGCNTAPAPEGSGSTGAAESTSTADTTAAEGSSTGEAEVTCPYEDPGWQHYAVDVKIPHWELVTHDGEVWRACDHYGSPIFIDTSAQWCGPCQALSAFLAGDDEAAAGIFAEQEFIEEYAFPFRDKLNAGCFTWVTVITQDGDGLPPTDADAAAWDAAYPNPNIPVIADPTGDFEFWMDIDGYPATFLINNDFKYITDDLGVGVVAVVNHLPCDIDGDGVPD